MKSLKDSPPSKKILDSFGISGDIAEFQEGMHGAFRVGEFVFKHQSDSRYWVWLCENIFSMKIDGLRLQDPIKTKKETWTEDGWYAYKFLAGETLHHNLAEKIRIAKILHSEFSKLPTPSSEIFDKASPWGLAEQMVWQEINILESLPAEVHKKISKLISVSQVDSPVSQIVHLDFCGNILCHENKSPAVIDLALACRPVEFAEAVLIYDSILWKNASIEEVSDWFFVSSNQPYLARAAAFRLLVTAIFDLRLGRQHFASEFELATDKLGQYLS